VPSCGSTMETIIAAGFRPPFGARYSTQIPSVTFPGRVGGEGMYLAPLGEKKTLRNRPCQSSLPSLLRSFSLSSSATFNLLRSSLLFSLLSFLPIARFQIGHRVELAEELLGRVRVSQLVRAKRRTGGGGPIDHLTSTLRIERRTISDGEIREGKRKGKRDILRTHIWGLFGSATSCLDTKQMLRPWITKKKNVVSENICGRE
jgi:hypothetical protein